MSRTRIQLADLLATRQHARTVDLSSRRRVMTDMSGAHLSGFRGRGMEFEEHRSYQPGDEVRTIDWRVTARTGQTHVRLYREERERPVVIATDLRPEMWFGTRGCFKSVLAAHTAALLAWSALENGDRIGGMCFGAGHHVELRPGGGRRSVLKLLHALEAGVLPGDRGPQGLADAIKRLIRIVRPGSIVALISDFRGFGQVESDLLRRLGRSAELIVGFVHDPLERSLPAPGLYPVANPDGGEPLVLDTLLRQTRARWQQDFGTREAAVQSAVRGCGGHWLDLATDRPLLVSIERAFGRRRRAA